MLELILKLYIKIIGMWSLYICDALSSLIIQLSKQRKFISGIEF